MTSTTAEAINNLFCSLRNLVVTLATASIERSQEVKVRPRSQFWQP